jgi:predicted NBD/HSP70 family sugar kinase
MSNQYVLGIDFSASQNVFFLAEYETGKIVYSKKLGQGAFYNFGKNADAEIELRKSDDRISADWRRPSDVKPDDVRVIDLEYGNLPCDRRASVFLYERAVSFLGEAQEKGRMEPDAAIKAVGMSVAGKVFNNGADGNPIMFLGGNTPDRFGRDIGGQIAIDASSAFRKSPEFSQIPVKGGNDCNTIGMVMDHVYQVLEKGKIGPGKSFYITVSTGIGGGGPLDNVDEVGHHSANMPLAVRLACGCKKMDCIEAYASGTGMPNFAKKVVELAKNTVGFQEFAIAERAYGFKIDLQTIKESKLADRIRREEGISSKDVFNAWKAKDKLASYLVDRTSDMLANVIANLGMDYDYRVVGIGGGVGQNEPEFVKLIESKVAKKLEGGTLLKPVRVEQNPLGKAANAYGAFATVIPQEHSERWVRTMLEEAERVKAGDQATLQRLQLDIPTGAAAGQARPKSRV